MFRHVKPGDYVVRVIPRPRDARDALVAVQVVAVDHESFSICADEEAGGYCRLPEPGELERLLAD